ncbi:hypothetical protein PPERSA_06597 [Pseudocohnilembus persalinus]|uniref:Leucine-rich repeat n=1 Tax=Pseudocohnilembus persalinus TaxID=266149 RepID=A0A0V0QRP6_PSEPJ|nr:hypothetical protein PPERSA_06597 [Pseudocohnilembus persalinus]|eukprot:KRX04963.1 hypothetical protein PPERSA_06597 [Pseudocohnilembus persalinus]
MAVKINQNLLQDLNRKSINLDINRLSQYLSEKPKDPGNFRVRPMSGNPNNKNANNNNLNQNMVNNNQKKEFDLMSTATSFFNKNNASFVVNNNNNNRERPQTASQKNQQMIKTLQMNLGQQKQQQQKHQYEDDLEKYIIETNHNNINNFNQELPLIENIDIENLEKYLKISQDEFYDISNVALKFDANCDSLQLLGEIMPILYELKLNNSIIPSIRDIGSSFQNLQILWINRVGLEELQGINAFPNLKELYANYNSIKDLMPLDFNDNIEILDLEGNDIEDIINIDYLETMGKLNDLNLSQNPITKQKQYREIIKKKIPNLQILDEASALIDKEQNTDDEIENKENQEMEKEIIKKLYSIYNKLKVNKNQDILNEKIIDLIEQELQKDPQEDEILLQSVKKVSKKFSKNKDLLFLNEKQQEQQFQSGTSGLTDGTDQAFSGNPLKALRHNKKQVHGSEKVSVPKENILKMIEFCKRTDNGALEELRSILNMNGTNLIDNEEECPPTIRKQTMKAGKKLINLEQIEIEKLKKQKEKSQNQNKLLFDDGFEVEDFDDENFGSDECEDILNNTDDDDEILQKSANKTQLNPVLQKDKSNIFKRDIIIDHKKKLLLNASQKQQSNEENQNIFKKQTSKIMDSSIIRPMSGSINPLDKSPLKKKSTINASTLKKNLQEKMEQHNQFQQQQFLKKQNSIERQSSSDKQETNSNSNSFMNKTNSSISTHNNSNYNNISIGNIGQTHNANEIMSKTTGNFKVNSDQMNKLRQGIGNPIKFSQGNSFQKTNQLIKQSLNSSSQNQKPQMTNQNQQIKIPSSLLHKKQFSQQHSPNNSNNDDNHKILKQNDSLQNNYSKNADLKMNNSVGFKKFDSSMLRQPIQLKRKILSGRGSSSGLGNNVENPALQQKNSSEQYQQKMQQYENSQKQAEESQQIQQKIFTKFKPLRPLNSAKKSQQQQNE